MGDTCKTVDQKLSSHSGGSAKLCDSRMGWEASRYLNCSSLFSKFVPVHCSLVHRPSRGPPGHSALSPCSSGGCAKLSSFKKGRRLGRGMNPSQFTVVPATSSALPPRTLSISRDVCVCVCVLRLQLSTFDDLWSLRV